MVGRDDGVDGDVVRCLCAAGRGTETMWWIISAVGIAATKRYFTHGKNAVWGGATLGLFIGVVVAMVRPGFDWAVVGHAIVVGAAIGLLFDGLGEIGDRLRR